MRLALSLASLAVLAACATPQEQCLAGVNRDLGINAELIAQTQTNLSRGFAVEERQSLRERNRLCRGTTESGEAVLTRCEQVDVRTRRVPVAIDLNAERDKLASLTQRRDALINGRADAQAQCLARFGS
jgi:hypothetical protein